LHFFRLRFFPWVLTLSILFCSAILRAEQSKITYVSNLAKESSAAVSEGKIFLLYVSRPDCPYCERLKKDVLHPLLKGGRFDQDLVLREVSLSDGSVIDFDNKTRAASKLLGRYEIVGTPTLLFLDQNGGQLTDKLSGYFSSDFYWSYLESNIFKSVALIRRP